MDGTTIKWNNEVKQLRIEDLPAADQERIRNAKPPASKESQRHAWTTAPRSTVNPNNHNNRSWGKLK